MKKIWGVLFLSLFVCSNSFAAMLSVTTGGHIAAASEVEDTIDNQGATLISSATIQNSKVVGFQESSNITLTTALPAGTVRGNFSTLATDAIAVGTIVNSYIIFLMPRADEDQVDHRDPTITFQFDPGEKVINVYDDAINDIDSSADSAFEQIEMAGKTYAAMAGVGGFELSAGNDTVAATTGTDSVGGTVTVGAFAGPTGDFVRVITQVQTSLKFSENTKSMIRSQSITSRAIIRQSNNQVQERMEFTRNLKENISQQNIKVGIDVNNNQANNLLNNLSDKTLNHSGEWFHNFAVWSAGSIGTGVVEETADILGENIYNNNTVTVGIDKKTKNNNTFGIATTRVKRDTEIGSSVIYIDTFAKNITTYANINFNEKNSLDILFGAGELENDIVRNLSTTSNTALREGYQVFSSLKYTANELFNNNKKFKKSRKSKKNKQTDFNFVKFNLLLIQNEYPRVLEKWDIDFNKVYSYETYIKLFSKLDKENMYPLLASLPINAYVYADEDEGYVYVNEDAEPNKPIPIDNVEKTKNNIDGSFYSKIDLGFTALDDYTEKGSTSLLVFNKQYVKSNTLALGTSLSKKHELSDGFIEPFVRLELGANLLHNSANYSYYTNNTEVTTYNVNEKERAHVRAGTGFKANLHNDLEINLSYDYYEEMGSKAANIDSYEQALNFTIKKYLNKN